MKADAFKILSVFLANTASLATMAFVDNIVLRILAVLWLSLSLTLAGLVAWGSILGADISDGDQTRS